MAADSQRVFNGFALSVVFFLAGFFMRQVTTPKPELAPVPQIREYARLLEGSGKDWTVFYRYGVSFGQKRQFVHVYLEGLGDFDVDSPEKLAAILRVQ